MTDAAIPPALSGSFVSTENNEHLVFTELVRTAGMEGGLLVEWDLSRTALPLVHSY